MANSTESLSLECWLDAALAGAFTKELRDDDGEFAGWWAENPECKGAFGHGESPDEARTNLREVLVSWVEVGQKLGHPISSAVDYLCLDSAPISWERVRGRD